jgi:hypothetical protein
VPKEFHVSPCYPVDGWYQMSLPRPGARLALSVTLDRPDGDEFIASMHGSAEPAIRRALLRAAIRHPKPPADDQTRDGARRNIMRHYDLSGEFFALFLDQTGVGPGCRLLEIGTGWGELAIRAGQRGATVRTITISRRQAELAVLLAPGGRAGLQAITTPHEQMRDRAQPRAVHPAADQPADGLRRRLRADTADVARPVLRPPRRGSRARLR